MPQLKLSPAWHTILTAEELRLITLGLVQKLKSNDDIAAAISLADKLTEQRYQNHQEQLEVLAKHRTEVSAK